MLSISGGRPVRACDGASRREVLRVGGLSLFGSMTLPRLLHAEQAGTGPRRGPAKSIVLVNLYGGPSHIDTFDMKPDAPAEVRGPFKAISTSLPGLSICEHLPKLAKWMHKATLIRSVTHAYNSHNPYAMLTGFTGGDDRENYYTKRSDHPGVAAVCQHQGLGPRDLPASVFLPSHPGYSQGLRRAGPYGGYLGRQFDPMFSGCDPKFDREFNQDAEFYNPITPKGDPRLPSMDETPGLTPVRLSGRSSLLGAMDRHLSVLDRSREFLAMDHVRAKAMELITSSRARAAFDLTRETEATRARYGPSLFGTSMLVARKLVEAEVPFVAVTTESRGAGHWDAHEKNFSMLQDFNLPNLDEIVPPLLEDLEARGLLDSTLVVVMGEMGRSPKVNGKAGRDHWPQCGFALLFGGGVKQGCVLGSSDRMGGLPRDRPVSPGDLVATMYSLLGIDPTLMLPDLTGRPIHIAHGGQPIAEILA
jgi:hypothetical protein